MGGGVVASASTGRSTNKARVASFFAGGVAGCVAKTLSCPLDRVKIFYQVQHISYDSNKSIPRLLKEIISTEGVRGLFRGNTAMMMRVFPYAAIQFASFDACKDLLSPILGEDSRVLPLAAGASAGVISTAATYPLDNIRANMAFRSASHSEANPTVLGTLKKMHSRDGVRAVYRGSVPTLVGVVPYAGISFFTYHNLNEEFRAAYANFLELPGPEELGVKDVAVVSAACGALAGAISQTVAYPIDVVRRHMQLEHHGDSRHHPNNEVTATSKSQAGASLRGQPLWKRILKGNGSGEKIPLGSKATTILSHIIKNEGIAGLYRGISINFIRVGPVASVSFTVHQYLKDLWTKRLEGME